MWQDFILTAGSLVFVIALIFSVTSKNKPAFLTSVLSGITLLIFTYTYFSLNLPLTALITLVAAVLWLTLAYQVKKNKKSS